ncbi:transposase [Fodinisporobacter ferrooxydans]|uniref:Transposase n=1 Tax=Fodinisporobacter ferrooxydans TaxID=2901836 RepID=A0ABY4CTZ6_9BACL|nr:transposase [Alicyclobacillaceae bacterium MYW30-H2]
MENWKEEIVSYHLLRFTNAAVEGRNNKIKALQRRHYFTRNTVCYKQRILLECNKERVFACMLSTTYFGNEAVPKATFRFLASHFG